MKMQDGKTMIHHHKFIWPHNAVEINLSNQIQDSIEKQGNVLMDDFPTDIPHSSTKGRSLPGKI